MEILVESLLSKKVLKDLNLEGVWYFVDYSAYTFPIGTLFTDGVNRYILTNVHLQWKNSFIKEISEGCKTICQFDKEIIYDKMIENNCWGSLPKGYQRLKLQKVPIAVIREENIDKILKDEMD
jgi:hypothetical protein